MAFGNLVVFIGNSLQVANSATTDESNECEFVKSMNGGTREFTQFAHGNLPGDVVSNWNLYAASDVVGTGPFCAFAQEWSARSNGGWHNLGDLFGLVVAKAGASLGTEYSIADSSQWNVERKRNNSSSQWDGTYYSVPTETGGVWSTGPEYSLVDTLLQGIDAAVDAITALSLTPRLMFVNCIHGHADALNTTAAANYESRLTALHALVANQFGITQNQLPWRNTLLAGDALDRVGAATINQAMLNMKAAFTKTYIIDPTKFGAYEDDPDTNYGGLYGSDNIHLSDKGVYWFGDANWNVNVSLVGEAVTL